MRIYPNDLNQHLNRGLANLYFIGGEEPLQRMEALDALRVSAKNQGYTEREIIELNGAKDETTLLAALNNISLFSTKKFIECRLKEGKISKIIQEILLKIIQTLPPDTILVILYPDKLDSSTLKTSWYQSLERLAHTVISSPIASEKFQAWLSSRAQKLKLSFTQEALGYLAARVEGNLVAATQTLEKLALIYPAPQIASLTIEQLSPLMIWENHHSVFELGDALLQGDYMRTSRILESLKNEGVESTLVCWVITREVRSLVPLALILSQGSLLNDALMESFRIWKQKRKFVTAFLQKHSLSSLYDILIQAKQVDTVIKTEPPKRAWQALLDLCFFCCLGGHPCRNA